MSFSDNDPTGRTRIDGALPTNTSGGLLSEGYMHGLNHRRQWTVDSQATPAE